MMLEITFFIVLILNSNCCIPVYSYSERAHTLSQYDQLTTSRFYLKSLEYRVFFKCPTIFSNLGWIKKEKLVNHKVVKLGQVGICRMRKAGVVSLGSLTQSEECLLVDGRLASRGWEVSLS